MNFVELPTLAPLTIVFPIFAIRVSIWILNHRTQVVTIYGMSLFTIIPLILALVTAPSAHFSRKRIAFQVFRHHFVGLRTLSIQSPRYVVGL
jgi:hypothetical protein